MASSAFWKSQIDIIEAQIADANELNRIGVSRVENGNDQIDFEDRMNKLWRQLRYLYLQYNNARVSEGLSTGDCFVPRRETGV